MENNNLVRSVVYYYVSRKTNNKLYSPSFLKARIRSIANGDGRVYQETFYTTPITDEQMFGK